MNDKNELNDTYSDSYIVVKGLEKGVQISGLTRGKDTKFHHTEKLDAGDVVIMQFTEQTSGMKIKGKALVYTQHGIVKAGIEE